MNYRPVQVDGKRTTTPEYRSWQAMKNRCLNPNASDYTYYGARGITIDPSWLKFDAFIQDMGPRPSPAHTLERREVDKPYGKNNCYWATRLTQARNRRFIKRIYGKTSWEWADELGITPKTFYWRLWRYRKGEITKSQLLARRGKRHVA